MPFVNCPQCKICQSGIRSSIDTMLSKGKSSTFIIAYAKENGLDTSKQSLSIHKRKHALVTKEDIEKKTRASRIESAARKHFNQKTKAIVSANKCLEDIITCAYDRMAAGEVKPSIDNALKAIELQARLKETGMLESSIISFMLEFTREGTQNPLIDVTDSVPQIEVKEEPLHKFPSLSEQPTAIPSCLPETPQQHLEMEPAL